MTGRSNFLMHLLLLAVLAVSPGLSGCSTNPATGRKQFNVLSEEREIRIGEKAEPEFLEAYGGELPAPEVVSYVRTIGRRLAADAERPDLPWEFHVLDSAVVNAFALPGGKVFISRALMAEMTTEAQLAGVLGHEIGHVTAQHQGQQMSQRLLVSGILIGLGIAAQTQDEDWLKVLGAAGGVGGTLYLLSYGRDQEHEADKLGVRYMTRLGYDPMGQVQLMEILARQAEGKQRPPEILSTHPLPENRIKRLKQWIAKTYPDRSGYRVGKEAYEQSVTERFKSLPPPKHDPDRKSKTDEKKGR